MTLDLTITSYIISAIVLYSVALFALSGYRRRRETDVGFRPLVTIMVPARNRNEERVLDETLENLCGLEAVAPYFADSVVSATQTGERIVNVDRSLLARLQDMELVAFTWLVQIALDHLGSSGLGGNGQFTRLSALA